MSRYGRKTKKIRYKITNTPEGKLIEDKLKAEGEFLKALAQAELVEKNKQIIRQIAQEIKDAGNN